MDNGDALYKCFVGANMFLKLITLVTIFSFYSANPVWANCSDGEGLFLTKKENNFDVLGKNPVVIYSKSPTKSEIVDQYSGFDCEILKVEMESKKCFKTYVKWYPGADVSGCRVQVTTLEDELNPKFLNLYMVY